MIIVNALEITPNNNIKDKWHIDKAKVKVEADVIATSIENMRRYTRIEEVNRK